MVTRDVFQLELEKRSVVQSSVNPVTGGIEIIVGSEGIWSSVPVFEGQSTSVEVA